MRHRQKVFIAPILTIKLSTKPKQNLNSADAFMARNAKNVKIAYTRIGNFDKFFGIAVVIPINFTDIFATTETSTYFQKKYQLIIL